MKKGLLALLVGATLTIGSIAAAEAMPVISTTADAAPAVTLVSGGCGFYYHRGPFGGCRPNGGYYRPYGYGYYGRPFFPGFRYGYRRF